MYLYDKRENRIDVYDLISDDKKLYEYRIEQMQQIPEEQKIICGITSTGIEGYEIFKKYENKFDTELIPIENANGRYHRLEPDMLNGTGRNREVLLDSYYSGYLKDRKIARLRDLKRLRYFLLNQTQYSYYFEKAILGGIIEIPKELYLLSLIEQEKFTLIGDKDVSEQLGLFSLEQTKVIDLDTLERMDCIGVAPGCYSRAIVKAANDAHILKLIRKYKS